jgi:hypothetical protein
LPKVHRRINNSEDYWGGKQALTSEQAAELRRRARTGHAKTFVAAARAGPSELACGESLVRPLREECARRNTGSRRPPS